MPHSSEERATGDGRAVRYFRSACLRGSLLTAGFWALAEGDAAGWIAGVPLIAVAALVSLALEPPTASRWTVLGLLRYTGFFLWGSLLGGFDVAQRALRPSLPIRPGLVRYPLRLPGGTPETLFLVTLSLMPGSLGTHIESGELVIHMLVSDTEDGTRSVAELEREVARLFGVDLGTSKRSGEVRDA